MSLPCLLPARSAPHTTRFDSTTGLMQEIFAFIRQPWPWWVAGPLLGLTAPVLLILENRVLGVSGNLRTLCAAFLPRDVAFFRYDWRSTGGWNLVFAAGILAGGFIGGVLLRPPEPMPLSPETVEALRHLGLNDFSGFVPREIFGWSGLFTLPGLALMVGGGLCIGFGAAYGGGCASGHGISGVASLQAGSLIAAASFFAAGSLASFFLLPLIL
jgi:uncharacterized protein